MTSVLNLASDPIDRYKQATLFLISPEQGDAGEFINISGEQRRFEQRTLLDHCNRGETEETDVRIEAVQRSQPIWNCELRLLANSAHAQHASQSHETARKFL